MGDSLYLQNYAGNRGRSYSVLNNDDDELLPLFKVNEKPRKNILYFFYIFGFVVILLLLSYGLFILSNHFNIFSPKINPAEGLTAGVSSDNKVCSRIGIDIIRDGGNAVDAAIGSVLCQGTINPYSSGIGGGGFMLISSPGGKNEAFDFREAAPEYFSSSSIQIPAPEISAKYIAVPGQLKGLEAAWRKYGSLPWKRLVDPSIKLAERYIVDKHLASILWDNQQTILDDEDLRDVFAPMGKILEEGDVMIRKKYANSLKRIAETGAEDFYQGSLAKSIVSDILSRNGILSLKDLEKYQVVISPALGTSYNGYNISTTNAPSSGPILLYVLNIIEGFKFGQNLKSEVQMHYLSEALKCAYEQLGNLGDPSFGNIDKLVSELISKENSSLVRKNISSSKSKRFRKRHPKVVDMDDTEASHVSVYASNMAVSVTSSLSSEFGSKIIGLETGIIFNDAMTDFSIRKLSSEGLESNKNNLIHSGKRPVANLAPAIVLNGNGQIKLVLGATGGNEVISSLVQTIVNSLDNKKSLVSSINSPRIHQESSNILEYEGGFDFEVIRKLQGKGHSAKQVFMNGGIVNGVTRTKEKIKSWSDYRGHGVSLAF